MFLVTFNALKHGVNMGTHSELFVIPMYMSNTLKYFNIRGIKIK